MNDSKSYFKYLSFCAEYFVKITNRDTTYKFMKNLQICPHDLCILRTILIFKVDLVTGNHVNIKKHQLDRKALLLKLKYIS